MKFVNIEKETTIWHPVKHWLLLQIQIQQQIRAQIQIQIQIEGESKVEKEGTIWHPLYTLASVNSLKEGRAALKRFEKGAAKKEIVTGDSWENNDVSLLHTNPQTSDPKMTSNPERLKGVIKTLWPLLSLGCIGCMGCWVAVLYVCVRWLWNISI